MAEIIPATCSRRASCWPWSSGTAERTWTGIRLCRRSQICRASRATADARPSRPWRLSTRRNRSTTLGDAVPEDLLEDAILLGSRDLGRGEHLRELRMFLQDLAVDGVEVVESRLGGPFVGRRVQEGLGVLPDESDLVVIDARHRYRRDSRPPWQERSCA